MPLFKRAGHPCAGTARSALTLALAITALAVPAAASAAPTASYSMTATPTQGQPTTFTSTSTCDRAPCTYEWTDPGDGQAMGTATSMTFTYHGTGTRSITLAVRNTFGQSASVTRSFTVEAATIPPTDTDGVPDSTDLCPGTPAGTTVDATGCPVTPPADTTAPTTTITSSPPDGTSTSGSVSFTGADNVGVNHFDCRMNGAAYAACTSPKTYTGLAVGTHTVSVVAVDAAGNVDASSATATWTTSAPQGAQCADGVDNDQDGKVDLNDPGCSSNSDNSESPDPAPPPPPGTRTTNCAPTAATTMTNSVSHQCGFPDTTNAGVPASTTLKRVPQDITTPDATAGHGWHWDTRFGRILIDTNGAVLQNVVTDPGNVSVEANNVTIQNSRLKIGHEGMGVEIRHAQNVTIQHNEIFGDVGPNRMLVGVKDVYSDAFGTQVLANNIYGWSSGVQIYRGLIADNYIHDPGYQSGDHLNGTTSNGFSDPLTIRHNTVFNSYGQTDAISLFEDFGTEANRVVDNNLVAGGGYCIYGGQNAGGPAAHDVSVTNNHFSRMYYPNCGSYGPMAAWPLKGGGGVFTGNVWDDTGAAVQG